MKTNSGPSVIAFILVGVIALVIVLSLPPYMVAVGMLCSLAFFSFLNRQALEARERIRK